MSGIKYFPQDLNIENKNIILRLDFNVPLKNKQIQDYTRISTVLPLLKDLVKRKSKIIILSHLGRPEGLKINDLSLLPVFKYLKKQLDTNIYFYTGEINELAKNKVSFLKSGEIILFENIRFFEGENKNDENFSEKLGGLADIFINDAFSCSHRAQASIHKITKFVKNLYGGPLLKKEINAIDLVIKNKKKPVTCIIGGSKISTKINIISNLMKNVDSIILVGAMANNFLAYKGFKVGKSLVESDSKKIIDKIYDDAKENNCKIIIPSDYSVSTSFDGSAKTRLQNKITDDEIILDIGPQTIEKIEDIIDKSNTVLWNGPAGYFENKNFAKGTVSIANKISQNTINRSLISILGGGDTVSAVNKIENELFFTHLSTAGGAFLEYLEGKDLPGLSVLK
jgi:phosphoglycerate kinase